LAVHSLNFAENVFATTQNSLLSDFRAEEEGWAGNFMGSTRLGRLNTLGGLRVEGTRMRGTGNFVTIFVCSSE